MLFKNHLFSSTIKKEAKRLKKKKQNQGHNITGQACVVCQDEVCLAAHAEAVEPLGGVMLGSDSHADLCPRTEL